MPVIERLSPAHRPRVNEYLRRFPSPASELTFSNLYAWRESRPVWITEFSSGFPSGPANGHANNSENTLVFLARSPANPESGWYGLGDPLGPPIPSAALAAAIPDLCSFDRITVGAADRLANEGWTIEPDPDNSDYVYRTADLADLAGEKYHKKRNLVRQCLEANHCSYEPIGPTLLPECLALQAAWCEARNCGLNPGLCHENSAILETFRHFQEWELLGGAIRVNGRISAFAVAEPLAPDTAVWHFEKALPDIHGLGQVINQWFAARSLRGFEFVNREQDLGLPGLRQAKESYHPHHRVHKFKAFRPDSPRKPSDRPPADAHECDRLADHPPRNAQGS